MASVFEIRPFEGVGPLSFGFTADDVAFAVGPPLRRLKNWKGNYEEYRHGFKSCYDHHGHLVEVVLFPPSSAILAGRDLFALQDPVSELRKLDEHPYQSMGISVFLQLGVSVTGFETTEDSEKAIGAFARGRWDAIAQEN
jgi:hypothetical protein